MGRLRGSRSTMGRAGMCRGWQPAALFPSLKPGVGRVPLLLGAGEGLLMALAELTTEVSHPALLGAGRRGPMFYADLQPQACG